MANLDQFLPVYRKLPRERMYNDPTGDFAVAFVEQEQERRAARLQANDPSKSTRGATRILPFELQEGA